MMSILMTFAPDRTAEAVMLAIGENSIRIALPGAEDAIELLWIDGRWIAGGNTPVELGALLTDGAAGVTPFAHRCTRVMVAGHA